MHLNSSFSLAVCSIWKVKFILERESVHPKRSLLSYSVLKVHFIRVNRFISAPCVEFESLSYESRIHFTEAFFLLTEFSLILKVKFKVVNRIILNGSHVGLTSVVHSSESVQRFTDCLPVGS